MDLFPTETAILKNLNSYYLNIERLFEHCQGELGHGSVHFRSPTVEAYAFFDANQMLGGIYQDRDGLSYGKEALQKLVHSISTSNFSVAIYKLEPEQAYYWSTVHKAEVIYKDLSTEFTDLESLVKKMRSEKFSGYIDVSLKQGDENGRVYFNIGHIIGTTCSWNNGVLDCSNNGLDRLVTKSREPGGVLSVGRIAPQRAAATAGVAVPAPAAPAAENGSSATERELVLVEKLLVIFERTVQEASRVKVDFDTALKRKFVQHADRFDFLDPFADEFRYENGKASFSGSTTEGNLAQGIALCVQELAEELGITRQMQSVLQAWKERYAKEIEQYGLKQIL
jgi:hypothetical protein